MNVSSIQNTLHCHSYQNSYSTEEMSKWCGNKYHFNVNVRLDISVKVMWKKEVCCCICEVRFTHCRDLKKNKINFCHHLWRNVVFLYPYNYKGQWGASVVLKPTDFNCIDKINIFQIKSSFVSHRRWNDMRMSKSWWNFQLWMNYPFKGEVCNLYSNKHNCKYY